VFSCSAENTL